MTAALEGGEWSAARPGRSLPPGKDPVPILREAGWALGPVWTGGKSRPHRDSIPARPARSELLYRLSYPTHIYIYIYIYIYIKTDFKISSPRPYYNFHIAVEPNCHIHIEPLVVPLYLII